MTTRDGKDPPIVPQDFPDGPTIVDIGEIRVQRGLSRRPFTVCPHRGLTYDRKERRIWCKDCERDIEAFDAFELLVSNYDAAVKDAESRLAKAKAAEETHLISRAAQAIDKAWRSKSSVPACPHCGYGLFPEPFAARQFSTLGRDYATAALARRTNTKRP